MPCSCMAHGHLGEHCLKTSNTGDESRVATWNSLTVLQMAGRKTEMRMHVL